MIAERLRLLRCERKISKRELVSSLPINYSTYANYESGFREPNSDVLQLIARHFDVSVDYILGASDNRKKADDVAVLNEHEHEHIQQYRRLDVHGREMVDMVLQKQIERVNLLIMERRSGDGQDTRIELPVYQQRDTVGLGCYIGNDVCNQFELMRFMSTAVSQKADFCVLVEGDSMEPKIFDNDIVFVKAMPRIEPDNIGLFMYEGEPYCKRLRVDYKNGSIYLESLNKAVSPMLIAKPEKLRTIGLVIGIAERSEDIR